MGLFASKPEEPTEWTGLPSEPLRPESAAERLDASAPSAPDLLQGSGLSSISIPMPEMPETPADTTVPEDE